MSLIKNIGLDGSGTHSGSGLDFMNAVLLEDHDVTINSSMLLEEDRASKLILVNYFRKNFTMQPIGYFQRIEKFILKFIKKYK